jgi:integrase
VRDFAAALPTGRGVGTQRTLTDYGRRDPRSGRPPSKKRKTSPGACDTAWGEQVESFVQEWQRRRSIGDRWQRGLRYTLGRLPVLFRLYGVEPPVSSSKDITEDHVTALRTRTGWSRATTQFYFAGLRQFLRWGGNAVSELSEVWRLPPGSSPHRRWITREELAGLLRSAVGPARLIIALEGFNGLRRVEVLRLRAQDVNLTEGWLNVRGKGRMGGKWRQIPLSTIARSEIENRIGGLSPENRILPYSASWADLELARAVSAAGFSERGVRVSHHDLRRTFGRIAHSSGMDLVQLKNLYGHANLDMAVHYIGLDLDRMREGLGQIDRALVPLVGLRPGAGKQVRHDPSAVDPQGHSARSRGARKSPRG